MRYQDAVSRGWLLHQPDIGVKKKNIGIVVLKTWLPGTRGTRSLGSLAGVTLRSGMFFSIK